MAKPEVEEQILDVLSGECSASCMDDAHDRRFTARKIYEMLCYGGYIYLDYDKVSDHATEELERRATDENPELTNV